MSFRTRLLLAALDGLISGCASGLLTHYLKLKQPKPKSKKDSSSNVKL